MSLLFTFIIESSPGKESEAAMEIIHQMFLRHIKLQGGKILPKSRRPGGAVLPIGRYEYITDLDLRKETGIHRIVRISPHDPQKRRWTTFTKVKCFLDDEPEVKETLKSYVFQPYENVKNHSTGEQSVKLSDILNGDFSSFENYDTGTTDR